METSTYPDPDKPNKPKNTPFRQQQLKGFRPRPNAFKLGIIYILLGTCFIIFGSIIIHKSENVHEISKRYDDQEDCKASWKDPSTCTISFSISDTWESPIFFYFEIKNMFQNHRKYNKSRDIYQLMGDLRTVSEIEDYCEPVVDMEDLGLNTTLELSESDPANPCGLVAKSLFNDTYTLTQVKTGKEIKIDSNDIAWEIDKEEKFERSDDSEKFQWTDVEDGKI